MRIILSLFICLLFSSCAANKVVYLSPVEPFEYLENNVIISINSKQDTWIYFQTPLLNELPKIWFSAIIKTNENIENVYLESINLQIKELNINIIKDNLLIQIPNRSEKLKFSEYYFWSYFDVYAFDTYELLDNDKSLNKLYKEFNEVKNIEIYIKIIYTINNNKIETIIKWNYNAKNKTSNARLDAMMGI